MSRPNELLLTPEGNGILVIHSKTHGTVETLISGEDIERVRQYRWHVAREHRDLYVRRQAKQEDGSYKTLSLHRFVNDTPPGLHTDHINHDTLNNTRENLRTVTIKENCINRGRVKGYSQDPKTKRYKAAIKIDGKTIHLGCFDTPSEARAHYFLAKKELLNYESIT